MSRISQLTAATALTSADQFAMNSAVGGDDMRAGLALLTAYMQANLSFTTGALVAQYAVPLTGTTVTAAVADTWLIITPAGTLAALTIALPTVRTAGQTVLVNCSQIITALTVSGSGTTVIGAPTSLTANAFFRLRFDAVTAAWYRIA